MSLGFGFSLPAYAGYAAGFGPSSFGSGATLALDFTSGNQTLDPRITFTRASTATRTNSSGLIETVAINAPRFDYDPVTLAPLGLLIEEQRTNLLLNTSVLETQVVTVTAAAHTLSFYGTGTIVLSGAFTGTVTGTGAYPTRTILTFTPIVGVLTVTVTGSVTSAQLETGAFPTSYIPTVASQVTRSADVAVMTGTNFSDWYNAAEGTLYAESAFTGLVTAARIAQLDDGTTSNFISLQNSPSTATSSQLRVFVNGTNTVFINTNSAYAANTFAKTAAAIAVNNFATTVNSAAVGTDTSSGVPVVNTLRIGASSSAVSNVLIKKLAYYPRRLANSELVALTS
jgi:hypothetical protein